MNKGRKLPELPPIEYCKLDRAAKLLDCEVSDILHWWKIHAIDLRFHFQGVDCEIIDSKYFNSTKNQTEKKAEENVSVRYEGPESGEWYYHILDDRTQFGGFWIVGELGYSITEIKGRCQIVNRYPHIESTFYARMGSQSVKAIVEKEALKRVDTSVQGLYIFRADLERIHHAVVKGEPLPNIYNNAELAGIAKQQEQQIARPPRTTSTQSRMIKALLQLHPSIDNDLINSPHSLFSKFQKMCADAGIHCPVLDGKTLAEWLERAK